MPAPRPSVRLAKGPLPLSAFISGTARMMQLVTIKHKVYAQLLEQVGVDLSENGVHCLNKNRHGPDKDNDFKKVQMQGLQHV